MKRHAVTLKVLRPLVGTWFQELFHSSVRSAFHLSFTVLVHYRSRGVFSLTGWSRQIHAEILVPAPLRIPLGFRLASHTQLSCSMAVLPEHSAHQLLATAWSYNPTHAVTWMVWAIPRSLATTGGIIVYFLFLQVLRCFSSCVSPPCNAG